MNGSTYVFENIDALYAALKDNWQTVGQAAIAEHGAFHVALSGGSTPRFFYKKLVQQPLIDVQTWHKTHIYFGDERCVPQQHEDSNFRMVQETLLSGAPLLPEHVHAMFSGGVSLQDNVSKYEALLHTALPQNADGFPVFDLVLLGVGEDGHTASLFPGTELLHESEKSVAAQFVPKLDAWRMSLTFPVINAARHVVVLVSGESKAKILSEISSASQSDEARYPIQQVAPAGQLDWYLDADAAQLLPSQDK